MAFALLVVFMPVRVLADTDTPTTPDKNTNDVKNPGTGMKENIAMAGVVLVFGGSAIVLKLRNKKKALAKI